MTQPLVEQATISEAAAAAAAATGEMPIMFISPGWGSSGYYSPEVIAEAATSKFIPAGTHMYADHPTDTEDVERPGRSIKDLMAVVTEDATLSADGALVGKARVVPAWRDLLETVRDHIGVSIRGSATDVVEGEAEGRRGGIIEGLVAPALSVDFVTRAGRGGKVLRVLESAATNQRALNRGIAEATVNDTREALQTVLRDAHGDGENVWVYVRDFDDTTVWFEVQGSGAADPGIFAQAYADTDGAVSLTGDRTEVRQVTKYVPVTRPDSTTPTTEETTEVTMGNIQIEESEHRSLVEKAGRVDALESERDTEKARADKAEGQLAERDRTDRARTIVSNRAQEAEVAFTEREVKGFLADVTLKEDGSLDEEAFTKLVDEEAAAKKSAGGAGSVTGFGGTSTGTGGTSEISESDIDNVVAGAFGRQVKEA